MYGEGISREGEIVDLGVKADIVQKSGAWFSYQGERLGQGRDNVKKLLRENPALAQEIEAKIREWAKTVGRPAGKPAPAPVAPAVADATPGKKIDLDISVDE
jgi:recombination protein RecA